jgi:diacylglycerol kinase (ATP)
MISNYLKARFRSIGHACRGVKVLLSTQPHARLHAVATIGVLIAGKILHLRRWEWVAILLCIGMVWMAESLNTGLEFLADEISRDHRDLIGKAKDIAAAGVLISAMISILVAVLVFKSHL